MTASPVLGDGVGHVGQHETVGFAILRAENGFHRETPAFRINSESFMPDLKPGYNPIRIRLCRRTCGIGQFASFLISDQVGSINGEMVVQDGAHLRGGAEDLLQWSDAQRDNCERRVWSIDVLRELANRDARRKNTAAFSKWIFPVIRGCLTDARQAIFQSQ